MIKGPYLGTFGAHFFHMICVLGDAEYAQPRRNSPRVISGLMLNSRSKSLKEEDR